MLTFIVVTFNIIGIVCSIASIISRETGDFFKWFNSFLLSEVIVTVASSAIEIIKVLEKLK